MAIPRQLLVLLLCFFFAAGGAGGRAPVPSPSPSPSPSPAPSPAAPAVSEIMKQTCSSTPYPELCIDALLPFPESQTADAHGLAELAIRAAAFLGANYWGYIATLRVSGDDCIHYCLEEYEDAIGQLDESTGMMEEKKYEVVEKLLSAAIAVVETCESDCKAATLPDKVAFSEKNVEFRHLCTVVLSIVDLLQK